MIAVAASGIAGTALAASAVTTSPLNVRSGPGTAYDVIDTLRRGERVETRGCRGGWCFVRQSGPDGFVSSRYLEFQSTRPGRDPWDDWGPWGDPWGPWDDWGGPWPW
ncbi:MAG TPA: SH3 domain-containing protein [Devosia sp.]|nr:SH3 domain-containing protein [Devosia sp.]